MNEYQQQLEQYLSQLPQVVQKHLRSDDWKITIDEIARKYSLDDEQAFELERETLFVMMGIENEDDFEENIINELSVSKLLAGELVEEVGTRVFEPVSNKILVEAEKEKIIDQKIPEETLVPNNNFGFVPDNLPTENIPEKEDTTSVIQKSTSNTFEIPKPTIKNSQPVIPTKLEILDKQVEKPSFFDQKLNSTTVSQKEISQSSNSTITQERPVKQYSVDPYREPVE